MYVRLTRVNYKRVSELKSVHVHNILGRSAKFYCKISTLFINICGYVSQQPCTRVTAGVSCNYCCALPPVVLVLLVCTLWFVVAFMRSVIIIIIMYKTFNSTNIVCTLLCIIMLVHYEPVRSVMNIYRKNE